MSLVVPTSTRMGARQGAKLRVELTNKWANKQMTWLTKICPPNDWLRTYVLVCVLLVYFALSLPLTNRPVPLAHGDDTRLVLTGRHLVLVRHRRCRLLLLLLNSARKGFGGNINDSWPRTGTAALPATRKWAAWPESCQESETRRLRADQCGLAQITPAPPVRPLQFVGH